jgi:uncharacterized protein YqgC (DUF456 family)
MRDAQGRRGPAGAVATLVGALVASFVALASAPVWALCPNCLGQSRDLGATLKLIGGFLLIPFVVAYVAQRIIRRACRTSPPPRE